MTGCRITRHACRFAPSVMAGLDPAIHVSSLKYDLKQLVRRHRVDARIKSGHDGKGRSAA
ncbi:hypothetical protein MTBLM5_490011 [Magnetospirillum sp. LM-5]|nr:hypothetical protein MTBLM5_490011 [Magnetospirillum sp. LM-5]